MFIYACLFTRKFTHVHLRMSSSRTPFTLAHAAKVTLSPNLFSHVTYSFTHVSLRMFIYACLTHARPFTLAHAAQVTLSPNLSIQQLTADQCAQQS